MNLVRDSIPAALRRLLHGLLGGRLTPRSPARGRHRRAPNTAETPAPAHRRRRLRFRAYDPPWPPRHLRRRRPLPAPDDPLPAVAGDGSPLVRPYVIAHEQEQRRQALTAALDGVDTGPWIIHGVPIGRVPDLNPRTGRPPTEGHAPKGGPHPC